MKPSLLAIIFFAKPLCISSAIYRGSFERMSKLD